MKRETVSFLTECRVLDREKISPFGTFRIIDRTVTRRVGKDEGLVCWSKKLARFRDGRHFVALFPSGVSVFDEHGEIAKTIQRKDIFTVELSKQIVRGGYLFEIPESTYILGSVLETSEALEMADRGEKPPFCDNSPFVRVSKKLEGKKMLRLDFSVFGEDVLVFDENGRKIKHKVVFPLAYKKWGEMGPVVSKCSLVCHDGWDIY